MSDRNQLDEEATKREILSLQPRYRFKTGSSAVIGTGGFGSVILAEDTRAPNGVQDVAIKVVGDDVLRHAGRRIVNELMLLRQIRHENIVALLNVFTNASPETPTNFTAVYLVFEWVQHDLRGIIYHRPRILHPNHVSWIMYQLFLALHFMHSCGVAHRDVTPTNILVNPTGTEVKVIDLGLSRVASPDPSKMTSYVTQRWYRAPEVVMSVGHDTKIDMWSAGTVLAEMIRNEPLFRLNTSRAPSEAQARSLRTQQLVRLLVVIGPPDDTDIEAVTNESVQQWLRIYRDKVARRTEVVEELARQILQEGGHLRRVSVTSPEETIRKVRDLLGAVSASQRDSPDTRERVAQALALLTTARNQYGEVDRERLGDPREDIVKILPHFTGGRSSLRQELPREVDPRCLNLLEQLLQVTPSRRPSAQAALQHPYVIEWFDSDDLAKVPPRDVIDSYTAASSGSSAHYDYRLGLANEVAECQSALGVAPMHYAAPGEVDKPAGRVHHSSVPRPPPGPQEGEGGMDCDDGEDYADDDVVAGAAVD